MGVKVELTDKETILIRPVHSLYPEYRDSNVQFFDDFVYVDGEGFYELPAEMRLPDRFRQEIGLEPDNYVAFFSFELGWLKRYASYIDHRLLLRKTSLWWQRRSRKMCRRRRVVPR